MKKAFEIEGKMVGEGQPCFLIAEVGSNHNKDKTVVRALIDAAADAGFDAVKFQIYDAAEAFSKNEMTTDVKLDHLYGVRPWWEIARDRILMPRDWFGEMFDYVRKRNMIPFSAIHRVEDAEFLMNFDLPVLKIASIDLHYHYLLKKLVRFGKPMLISTGMAYLSEIDETMRLLEKLGCDCIALLHCVSCYPPDPDEMNLRNIPMLSNAFDVPVGFSDHSTGVASAVAATALGASVLEKHITLDRKMEGPDHSFALELEDMKRMVEAVREVEKALGQKRRRLSAAELSARRMIRRSIVARENIHKGEAIVQEKIKYARPGTGIPANDFRYVNNCLASVEIPAETIICWEMIEPGTPREVN